MRTGSALEARILELVEPVADDLGLAVVRVRILASERGSGTKRIQIMAERAADGLMGVEDCANLSRALSAVLDVADPLSGHYDLEVSSPGIDRPLTLLSHFARWEGFEAKIELDRLVENRKRFRGALAGVEEGPVDAESAHAPTGGNVLIDLDGEDDTAVVPFAWIADARLVLTDALIEESLKQAKKAQANLEDTPETPNTSNSDAPAGPASAQQTPQED